MNYKSQMQLLSVLAAAIRLYSIRQEGASHFLKKYMNKLPVLRPPENYAYLIGSNF